MKVKRQLHLFCVLCTAVLQSINSGAQPVITSEPANQTLTNGSVATFAVQVSGAGPFSYQWRLNGNNLPMNDYAVVTTVADIEQLQGFSGDGGPALLARFWFASGICVDKVGNIYIADQFNNRIRKVDTNGIITTVAGNGIYGYSGDGGSATNASFKWPYSVAVDQKLNLYVADQFNRCIRKVDTNGIITTVAGGGTGGYTNGGPATNATFGNLTGTDIAVDNLGNLFIADSGLIREVNTNGIIYTVAGGGTNYPGGGGAATNAMIFATGVAVDNLGNVFIANTDDVYINTSYGSTICKVDTNGIITVVAGGNAAGPYAADGLLATNVYLGPLGEASVAADTNGNIYIGTVYIGTGCVVVNSNGVITRVLDEGGSGIAIDAYGNALCSGAPSISFPNSQGPTLRLYGVSTNLAGQYTVVVSNAYGSVTSTVANLSVIWPPGIYSQPASQTVVAGSEVVFSVSALGSAPLHYQWEYNGISISSATNTFYIIYSASTNNSGNYGVIVTNLSGSVTSSLAMLTIGVPPTITNQPMSQVVSLGNNASFNVSAGGSPTLYYQWFFNGTNIFGATSYQYTVVNATTNNAGHYYAFITNAFGSITSSVATLTVGLPPQIITQPQNIASTINSSNFFTAVANGTSPLSYQWWLVSIKNSNAVATPWVVNGFVVGAYIISGGAGYLLPPQVQFLGGSGSGAAGTAVISNGMVTAINMSDAGVGYTTPPTLQIAAPFNIALTNQTNAVLSFSGITNGNEGDYYVVVTNNFGSVTSTVAQLIVFVPPQDLYAITSNNNQLIVHLTGTPNFPYILQSATNLASPVNWLPVFTNTADSNGDWVATITNLRAAPQGFFRAVGQ